MTTPSAEQIQTIVSQRLLIARLVGKGSLGLGFIVAIFGVTNNWPLATRSGLALLLVGIVATLASFVHALHRRRLQRATRQP
jgi:ABC-type spermidine/putrescine transport system permease subunit I